MRNSLYLFKTLIFRREYENILSEDAVEQTDIQFSFIAMSKSIKGITSWPQSERPRERLLSKGAQALTDAELIAVLIRVGYKGKSAVDLGRDLLNQFGSLRAMIESPVIALLGVKGLKNAKAAQLLAAIEVARRLSIPLKSGQLIIKSTQEAADYLKERMNSLAEEQFRILYVNRKKALLNDVLIAQGVVDAVRPLLRTIVIQALQFNASGIVAAHNHPSGMVEPSESDRLLTLDLISACRPLGIKVLDHLIIGKNETFSFSENGLMDELELICQIPNGSRTSIKLQRAGV